MATDPKTGQIINDDKSMESIRADRSAELSNPGDEGPKIPKDLAAAQQAGQKLPDGVVPSKDEEKKEEDK